MSGPATPWTYEDYLDFPDDGKRYETVDGEVFVTPAANTRHQDTTNLQGPPTLAIEVLADPRHDRVRKRRRYAQFGVAEYWIGDPDGERVEVYRLDGRTYPTPTLLEAGTRLTTGHLPGFSIHGATLLAAGS